MEPVSERAGPGKSDGSGRGWLYLAEEMAPECELAMPVAEWAWIPSRLSSEAAAE